MSLVRRSFRVGLIGFGTSALVAGSMLGGAVVQVAAAGPSVTTGHVSLVGHASLVSSGGSSTEASGSPSSDFRPDQEVDEAIPHAGNAPARLRAVGAPRPAPTALGSPDASGFAGLTHLDQHEAGTGKYAGTQWSLEPPDQALCVGNGYVVEAVNNAVRVNGTDGSRLTAPTALSEFFDLAPEVVRYADGHSDYGDFISDPKCYFDAQTDRFFLTELQIDVNKVSGDLGSASSVLVAVTKTGDPTGSWNIYKIDTTNDDGSAEHAGCPCLGDQPLIGADANGFYISTNEFSIDGPEFNGAQIYALDKAALAAGDSPVNQVVFNTGTIATPDPGGIWYTVQPATTPPGGSFAPDTEYFMSALQFGPGNYDNRIAVWAMTGTSTLSSETPAVSLTHKVIGSEVYGMPPASVQKGNASQLVTLRTYGVRAKEKVELINANDDRMNQVVYADGMLWSGLNTAITGNGPTRPGIAWFVVEPTVSGDGDVNGRMDNQGYLALAQNTVMFPSIGVNSAGQGIIAFSVAGPDFYPSTGYATIDAEHGTGPVHIAGAGAGPDDGFTGYTAFGGSGVARWGDYTAAVAAEDGSIWSAAEYIPGGPRSAAANWGTYISHITP